MAALECNNLTLQYKGAPQPSVKNVSLKLEKGEFFALLGPNGAGKSTFFAIIAGLLNDYSGKLQISGRNASPRFCRQQMAIVPQDIALYPQLTAQENLNFFARLFGLQRSVMKERVSAALQAMQLDHVRHRVVKHFSGGMQRRLNLAVGLLVERKLLLLDEPTVGVDPQSRQLIYDVLRQLNEAGTTIIYSTHYLEEVTKLCTGCGIMSGGEILFRSSANLRQHPLSIEALYLRHTGEELTDV